MRVEPRIMHESGPEGTDAKPNTPSEDGSELPKRKSKHSQVEFATDIAELESRLDRATPEEQEADISGHLVRLIDFFFGLVIAQGVLRFDTVFKEPWNATPQVLVALVIIYYTVVRSFIAWHSAIEQWRYRVLVSKDRIRTIELWRVYTDIFIVIVYAFLLLTAEPLIHDEGADISAFLFGFPVLFALYVLWGRLRRIAWGGNDPFNLLYLVFFGFASFVVAGVYKLNPDIGISEALGNTIALGCIGLLMVLYRFINFWQGEIYRDAIPRWRRLPLPRLPKLGAD